MKKCRQCGEMKPDSEFHKHPTATDLLRKDCKECRNAKIRDLYRTDTFQDHLKEYRSSDEYKRRKAAYMREYNRRKRDEINNTNTQNDED